MTSPRYDLYGTWAGGKLVSFGRRERCERTARHLEARGIPSEVRRAARVTIQETPRDDRGDDDQFEYLRASGTVLR